MVYNDVEWVAYMDPGNKADRSNRYKGLKLAGTTDWAVDLDSFVDDTTCPKTSPSCVENQFQNKGKGDVNWRMIDCNNTGSQALRRIRRIAGTESAPMLRGSMLLIIGRRHQTVEGWASRRVSATSSMALRGCSVRARLTTMVVTVSSPVILSRIRALLRISWWARSLQLKL